MHPTAVIIINFNIIFYLISLLKISSIVLLKLNHALEFLGGLLKTHFWASLSRVRFSGSRLRLENVSL